MILLFQISFEWLCLLYRLKKHADSLQAYPLWGELAFKLHAFINK